MSLLTARHLKKSFEKNLVLKDISMTLARGESLAICGRSGEGKTTLLHLLGGLEAVDSGTIFLADQPITPQTGARLRQRQIGFVFQFFHLLEDFTALENILMPSRIARLPIQPSTQRALQLFNDIDLSHRMHAPVKTLSGGERQRVAIARALANNPDLILADEPSGNLDRSNAQRIGELLLHCVRKERKSLILVTHDSELAQLCDRRLILQNGILSV